jgi:hypothetical protein
MARPQPLFPTWMTPGRQGPQPRVIKDYAIFPCGTESEIVPRKSPVSGRVKDYVCRCPDGSKMENTMLRDLKDWLEDKFPGVRFERRKL